MSGKMPPQAWRWCPPTRTMAQAMTAGRKHRDRRGAATTAARNIRLALGTGLLGGYTTYSTFAVEVLGLGGAGHGVLAGVYALGSLAVGAAAAWAGIALARTFTPSQGGPP